MAINWGSFQNGLKADIEAASAASTHAQFATQLAAAITSRLQTAIGQAEVSHDPNMVTGTCPSGGGPLISGASTEGKVS